MHEAFRPYLTELRSQLSEGLGSVEVEDAVCEIGAHLELTYEEGLRGGLSHGQAYELALRSLGSGDLLATELKVSDGPRLGPWSASEATRKLGWLYGFSFLVMSWALPQFPMSGLVLYVGGLVPLLVYAMFLASSILSKHYQVKAVGLIVLVTALVQMILALATPGYSPRVEHWPQQALHLLVTGMGGHLLMVWLGRYSNDRQRWGIAR